MKGFLAHIEKDQAKPEKKEFTKSAAALELPAKKEATFGGFAARPERDFTTSPLRSCICMDDVELRQQILQRTLQEVADEEKEAVANPCVICLDTITEPCVAQPCHHANFDFICLLSWLEQQQKCPLCK